MAVFSRLYEQAQANQPTTTAYVPPPNQGGTPPAYSGPDGWDAIYDSIVNRSTNRIATGQRLKPSEIGADWFATTALRGGQAGAATATPVAYANLIEALLGKGQTDPALVNRQVADISRGTAGQQQQVQGELARRGMSRSGVGQALSTAVGQGGENRIAQMRATEAQLAEDRKRQDLDLFLRMVVDPSLNSYGLTQGVAMQNRQMQQNQQNGYLALLGTLLGGIG